MRIPRSGFRPREQVSHPAGHPKSDVLQFAMAEQDVRPLHGQRDGHDDDSWAQFWSHLRGSRRDLRLLNSGHLCYTDLRSLLPPAATLLGYTPELVSQLIGTIDPARAVQAIRAYVRGLVDLDLGHRDSGQFGGPSPRYPEIQFVP